MDKILTLFMLSLSSSVIADEAPLISPLPESAWNEQQKTLFSYLQSTDPENKKPLNMLGSIAHHPELLDVFLPMATQLGASTTLPSRQMELLALRTAWRAESSYEWGHHYDYGLVAGLSEEEMQSLLQEEPSVKWNEAEQVLIRATDELVAGTRVHAETMQQLMKHFSQKEVIEILFVINQYNSLSKFANSLGIQLEAGYQR